MIKYLLVIWLWFHFSDEKLNAIRYGFFDAAQNEESFSQFKKEVGEACFSSHAVEKAYQAATLFFEAKYQWNPYLKWKYFNKGKALLDEAISIDAENVEIRFIRYAFQKEIPEFLGYNQNLIQDYEYVKSHLHLINDINYKKRITSYLIKE